MAHISKEMWVRADLHKAVPGVVGQRLSGVADGGRALGRHMFRFEKIGTSGGVGGVVPDVVLDALDAELVELANIACALPV